MKTITITISEESGDLFDMLQELDLDTLKKVVVDSLEDQYVPLIAPGDGLAWFNVNVERGDA